MEHNTFRQFESWVALRWDLSLVGLLSPKAACADEIACQTFSMANSCQRDDGSAYGRVSTTGPCPSGTVLLFLSWASQRCTNYENRDICLEVGEEPPVPPSFSKPTKSAALLTRCSLRKWQPMFNKTCGLRKYCKNKKWKGVGWSKGSKGEPDVR